MRRIAAGVLALAALLVTPLPAATRATIQQLAEMLTSAHASRRPDDETARGVARVELTERLTEATLSGLSRDQGERTKAALRILADESMFLDPPAAELPAGGPPVVAEQKAILARALDYALAYMRDLPNFRCTEITRRLDDDPSSARRGKADIVGRLHERDTIVSELTFSDGTELRHVRTVNDRGWSSEQPVPGLTTFGEFGGIIGSVFSHSSAAKAVWSHWETIDGKRVAVFNYSVDGAHSSFVISWCCAWEGGGWRREKTGYRGALFIEPASGAIFRVTRQAVDIPAGFPTRRGDTAVEFRVVNIGGKSWLCPVRSVAISDSVRAEGIAKTDHPTGVGLHLNTLNEVEFTDYHKFESAARLLAADVPLAEDKAGVSAPPTAPAEPQLAPVFSVADAAVTEAAPEASQSAEGQADEKSVARASVAAPPVVTTPAAVPPPPPGPETEETPSDGQAIFRARTNVVTVRVVVRDDHGDAVGDIRKDEFELFDKGKRQAISSFSVESPASANHEPVLPAPARNAVSRDGGSGTSANGTSSAHAVVPMPDRFVMYVLDDLNLSFGSLSRTRTAAEGVLQDSPNPVSRVAVLTTAGRIGLGFTADPKKVNETLDRITPQGLARVKGRCPELGYYLSYRVVNGDELATNLATAMVEACGYKYRTDPRRFAEEVAEQTVREYNEQTQAVLAALKTAVRRMSIMPGRRTIVLVSPGFITLDLGSAVNDVIDSAVRAGVVINTLDARGVWVLPGAKKHDTGNQYDENEQDLQSGVLIDLAEGTGGTVFRSNNDFAEGFRRLTAVPEVSYTLGFTPAKLKADGSYHKLEVTMRSRKGLTVQARSGYFAPKHNVDPAEQAKEEIENAVFTRDDIQDIPVTLRTQVVQNKLTVVARVGIGGIRFVRKDGHNRSSLTANVSLFDAAGGALMKNVQDPVDLDFPDDKLAAAMASGVDVKADFEVAAGSYMVRVVLRDGDGHMSSTSRLVEAP